MDLPGLRSDLRFAGRTLRRNPLFTAAAVLSLALGIGANTAIFTLLDQLVLRLLPVRDPDRLVMIWSTGPHIGNNRGIRAASYPMYQDFQQRAREFLPYVFARYVIPASLGNAGSTERVQVEAVSGNYFQALGVKPALGRVFTPEEDDRVYKGHPVAVLSYDYWQNRFGGRNDVLGQKILINNQPMTVVGVSGKGYIGLDPTRSPQVRVPIQMTPFLTPGNEDLGNRRSQWMHMFARMAPGETPQTVEAKLQPILSQILEYETTLPSLSDATAFNLGRFRQRKVIVEQASNGFTNARSTFGLALQVLMAMVGVVLLIACANVANLILARSAARRKELAVRLSVGASRFQLIRQLLIESAVISTAGAALGISLAILGLRALITLLPPGDAPLMVQPAPDLRVLGFSIAVAMVTALLVGLAPAWQATRLDHAAVLKDTSGAVSTRGGVGLRKALVVAQLALSFLLLAGAGLFVKSLTNLKTTDTGFDGLSNLVTFQVNPALSGYTVEREKAFYQQLLDQVRAIPGVKSAALALQPLLTGSEWDSTIGVEGHTPGDGEDMQGFMNALSPGYFETMGIRLLQGRDFRPSDAGKEIRSAVVNREFAEHFFKDREVIGRRIGFGVGPRSKLDIQIVGVVENTLYEGPRQGVHRQVFIPRFESNFPGSVAFYVRAAIDSRQLIEPLRAAVRRLDASMPIYGVKTLETQLDETLYTERLIAGLSGGFGALATLLAAIGLYGVMAFTVARRTTEIGIRMALGAQRATVLWMVLREVLVLLVVGLVIAVPASFYLNRLVAAQLFNMQPTDLATSLTVFGILSAVTLAAALIPARRASSIDAMHALRHT